MFQNPIHVPFEKKLTQLQKGLLEFIVLKIITNCSQSLSITEITKYLSKTIFSAKSDTLYPLLSKMHKEGLVGRIYEQSEIGKPRKHYYATHKGNSLLVEFDTQWSKINTTVSKFIEGYDKTDSPYFPTP